MKEFAVQELTLGQLLENTAARFPDNDAVIHADRDLRQTWSEFSDSVDAVSYTHLAQKRPGPGRAEERRKSLPFRGRKRGQTARRKVPPSRKEALLRKMRLSPFPGLWKRAYPHPVSYTHLAGCPFPNRRGAPVRIAFPAPCGSWARRRAVRRSSRARGRGRRSRDRPSA